MTDSCFFSIYPLSCFPQGGNEKNDFFPLGGRPGRGSLDIFNELKFKPITYYCI